MTKGRNLVIALPLLMLIAACQGERGQQITAGMDMVMIMPVTTSSDAARSHFMLGQHALDVGRGFEAIDHFKAAVEADPTFAFAYLRLANTANSTDEFVDNAKMAAQHAGSASEAEQLQIQITQTFLNNDVEGRLRLAEQLVEVAPESPRAWQTLAGIQAGRNNMEDSRASIMKAAELSPDFAPAYAQLGNSYLFLEPRDFTKAEENFAKVVELEPDEPNSYDLLGDAFRAQNELTKARDSYTRAAELSPHNALFLQQRGHANSFLGDYDAARADYTAAMALGRGNEQANFAQWRAYVSVYAGDPEAAIVELNELASAVDGMGMPGPLGIKIGILTDVATIALHHNNFSVAEAALDRRAELMMEQADKVGTVESRRGQEANIIYFEGQLAARMGDYGVAAEKAAEFMSVLEPSNNPRKNEPAHDLLGLVSLLQGDYNGAIGHFDAANPNNVYTQYHLALAYEGAGNSAAAMEIFESLAVNNFNFANYALIRADAIEKSM